MILLYMPPAVIPVQSAQILKLAKLVQITNIVKLGQKNVITPMLNGHHVFLDFGTATPHVGTVTHPVLIDIGASISMVKWNY